MSAATMQNVLEGLPKLTAGTRVDNWVDTAVKITQPKGYLEYSNGWFGWRVQGAWPI